MHTENAKISRGQQKITAAVRRFNFDFRGKRILDIGSSTGGFTEEALKLGASKVVAVEKGTNQMRAPLRYDQRICLREKTDIFDVKPAEIGEIDAILADVSFVSLRKILKKAKEFANGETDFLVMLKPQFEAEQTQLVRGVVKNEKTRREIVKKFELWLKINGFLVKKKQDNEIVGRFGNLERFYWLKIAENTTKFKKKKN